MMYPTIAEYPGLPVTLRISIKDHYQRWWVSLNLQSGDPHNPPCRISRPQNSAGPVCLFPVKTKIDYPSNQCLWLVFKLWPQSINLWPWGFLANCVCQWDSIYLKLSNRKLQDCPLHTTSPRLGTLTYNAVCFPRRPYDRQKYVSGSLPPSWEVPYSMQFWAPIPTTPWPLRYQACACVGHQMYSPYTRLLQ